MADGDYVWVAEIGRMGPAVFATYERAKARRDMALKIWGWDGVEDAEKFLAREPLPEHQVIIRRIYWASLEDRRVSLDLPADG